MYFLKDYDEKGYDAGSKARIDCEKIMKDLNCKPINFYLGERKIYYKSFLKRYTECKKLNSGDILIIQYPYYFKYCKSIFSILKKLRRRNVKIVAIIHDILSLRSLDTKITIEDEVKILNNFDILISHNENMSNFLIKNGIKRKIKNLEIFDYLSDNIEKKEIKDFKNVYIAGNLNISKSQYIYNDEFKNIKSKVYLYGPNFDEKNMSLGDSNIEYKGCFPPEKLGEKFGNGFGLVWDGTSMNSCDGEMGKYLKYNNPHKTSMYLSIGMPVIVWSEAAISKFIKKNKLGICIESLNYIDEAFNNITIDEYREMKKNCEKISTKIRNGYFLKKALKNALEEF